MWQSVLRHMTTRRIQLYYSKFLLLTSVLNWWILFQLLQLLRGKILFSKDFTGDYFFISKVRFYFYPTRNHEVRVILHMSTLGSDSWALIFWKKVKVMIGIKFTGFDENLPKYCPVKAMKTHKCIYFRSE